VLLLWPLTRVFGPVLGSERTLQPKRGTQIACSCRATLSVSLGIRGRRTHLRVQTMVAALPQASRPALGGSIGASSKAGRGSISLGRLRPVRAGAKPVLAGTPLRTLPSHYATLGCGRAGFVVAPRAQSLEVSEPAVEPKPVKEPATADPFNGERLQNVPKSNRPRIVVLGSGWGAISFLKSLDPSCPYDVVVVSPRNYFLYTPLLPGAATGTVEDRSIVEPVRRVLADKNYTYLKASAQHIDPTKKLVHCKGEGITKQHEFDLSYDFLVTAVGSVPNTFGVPGVEDNCLFFKEIGDAAELRHRVNRALERASLPETPKKRAAQLLTVAIVGGGPTGVELAGELYDLLREDVAKQYSPELLSLVKIVVVELEDHILSMYDRRISEYATEQFKARQRKGEYIELVLNSRVTETRPGQLVTKNKTTGEESVIDFGLCVWSTGIKMHPLCAQLRETLCELDAQSCPANMRSLATDPAFRVLGSAAQGSIFALGDCATVEQPRALEHVERLFASGDVDGSGILTKQDLKDLFSKGSNEFPHLAEFAKRLDKEWDKTILPEAGKDGINQEQFHALVERIDSGLRAYPATAQVAKQQGDHLAALMNAANGNTQVCELLPKVCCFFSFSSRDLCHGYRSLVRDSSNLSATTTRAAWHTSVRTQR